MDATSRPPSQLTDLAVLTLMSRPIQGSAAGHRWQVPSSTCASTTGPDPLPAMQFRPPPPPQEMAVRVAAAIKHRLEVVVQVAEAVLKTDGSGGRVF